MFKKIAVTNHNGGVGKSVTSTNIAKGLANKGYKVLLIDADPQATTTDTVSGIGNEFSSVQKNRVKEMIEKGKDRFAAYKEVISCEDKDFDLSDVLEEPENILKAIYKSNFKNIDILPATIRLDHSDKDIRDDNTRSGPERLKIAFEILEEEMPNKYDFVISDNAPRNDLVVTNTVLVSDLVIIPIKCDRKSARGFIRTLETLLLIQRRNRTNFDFKLLLQMTNRNNNDKENINFYQDIFPDYTFNSFIRYQGKPISDADLNKKIVIDDKHAAVAKDYEMLVDELLQYFGMV